MPPEIQQPPQIKIPISEQLKQALLLLAGKKKQEELDAIAAVLTKKEPLERLEKPPSITKAVQPEAIAVIQAAITTGQPLEQIAAKIPKPAEAPKLTEFLANTVESLAQGASVEQAVGSLRDAVMKGKVEFREGKEVLKVWVKKIDRPDLFIFAKGASGAAPTAVEQIYQGPGDPLRGSILERSLQDIKMRIISDDDPLFHDTHKIPRLMTELEDIVKDYAWKHGGYDSPEVQAEVNNLHIGKSRLQRVIDETVKAQQARSPSRREALPTSALSEDNSDWVYLKDENGHKIEVVDRREIINGVEVTVSMQPLRDALKQLEGTGYVNDTRSILAQAKVLEDLVFPGSKVSYEDIKPYLKQFRAHLRVLESQRFQPNSIEMKQIKESWQARDRIFFDRINNVLQNQFEQSRQVMNLYLEAGVDVFIEAVRVQMGKDGDKWASHYEHLKQSIFFNHDLEQIARGPQGDVEVLQKLMQISHTSFMLEATQDPVVEAMSASLEQALRQILQDHNGYLPPDLFSLKSGKVEWNEMARRIFETKVRTGQVRDYMRKEDGWPVEKENRIGYKLGATFGVDDLKNQKLRIDASIELAKGVGVFNHRLLELFASAKAPGFETADSLFSSIPLEALARYMRPTAHLFGKYHMGEIAHKAIFSTLIGGRMPELVNFTKWSPHDFEEVSEAMLHGELSGWLKGKYGEKLGGKLFKEVTPFIEIMGDMLWTGRVGPHSNWGEHDATLYFTDLQRELEGGSIRIGRAGWWANRYLEGKYHDAGLKWADIKITKEGQAELAQLTDAYTTWVWAQMTLRSPMTVAENVWMTDDGVQTEDKVGLNLRNHLINKILGINVAKDVTTEATPNESQRKHMDRIAILEADVAAIQHAALYGGENGEPRDIRETDYNIIQDDNDAPDDPLHPGQKVDAETRRRQAREYIESVRTAMFGDTWKTMDDVVRALGVTVGTATVKHAVMNEGQHEAFYSLNNMLHIGKYKEIKTILGKFGKGPGYGKLSAALVARKQGIYMGMDDTRLGDMDFTNLGERAFVRLTNDFVNRKEAIGIMQELLGEFNPHMDQKKVIELIKKLYATEKAGRGPDDSAKAFVYYFGRLFGEYYRGHWVGKLPILGNLIRRFVPLSVAQMTRGVKADSWSINNMNEWIHLIDSIGALPHGEYNHDGTPNTYSIERMERELIGGDAPAISEAAIISYILLLGIVMATAAAESIEETGGSKRH